MDIYTLYHYCLDSSDKRYLAYLLKKEIIKASNELIIKDWINTVDISCRLRNILLGNYCDESIYPSQITKQMFLSLRNTGIKTWREFEELRGDNL